MTRIQESSSGREFSVAVSTPKWTYDEAFSRHRGLLTDQDQRKLRSSHVAIIGMGGVGGIHLVTLARLGIGAFSIADPDLFEVANFNRQYGANSRSLGKRKAEVMASEALAINPKLRLRRFGAISKRNIDKFLEGVDVLIDGVDFFSIEVRRLVFREARRRGIWSITAAPLGYSTAWFSFSPNGMAFDEYFDINDSMTEREKLIAFGVGLAPRATHLSYLDLSNVDLNKATGPSLGLACQLCGGVAAAEVTKILLGNEPLRPAPWYFQFDARRLIFRKGKLRWGNRHPWQRFKRWFLAKRLQKASVT